MDKRQLLFMVVMTVILFAYNAQTAKKRMQTTHAQKATELVAQLEPQEPVQREPVAQTQEKLYVLQTPYQQLVFSNVGGALVEINLPFESDDNELSVVREIGFDREMLEEDPENAQFPDTPYYLPGDTTAKGRPKLGGYYPLLRRSVILPDGETVAQIPAQNYALNITSKYPEMAETPFAVKQFTKDKIVFESKGRLRTITKTYTLPSDVEAAPYTFDLEIDAQGDRAALKGLWLTSGVPDVEMMSGRPMPAMKMHITRQNKTETNKISLPKPGQPNVIGSIFPDWLVNSNGYFGIILDPIEEMGAGYRTERVSGTEVPSRLTMLDRQYNKYKPAELPGYQFAIPLNSGGGKMKVRVYAGPMASSILKTVDATYVDPLTGMTPGYITAKSFHGYFKVITEPFAAFLLIVLRFFHLVTRSWAASIILLTIVLRLMLYPLSSWSMKSMHRMKTLAPQLAAIDAKHKKDPKKAQMEKMAFYKDKKINPISGCLPLLIQMPFLVAMFNLLRSTYDLRGAPFIPGWIDNLTAPDVLFSWSQPIFFFGNSFHLLPILLAGVMFITQRFASTLPKDKSLWTDQQKQQRTMSNVMVIVFGVMFYRFPSGLNLYWLSSMSFGALQQWWINRKLDNTPEEPQKRPSAKRDRKKARAT